MPGHVPLCQPLPRAQATGAIIFSAILEAEDSGIVFGGCGQLASLQGPRRTSEAQLPLGARSYEGAGGTLPGLRTHGEHCPGHRCPGSRPYAAARAARAPGASRCCCPAARSEEPCPACGCSSNSCWEEQDSWPENNAFLFLYKMETQSRRSCHPSPLSATGYLAFVSLSPFRLWSQGRPSRFSWF